MYKRTRIVLTATLIMATFVIMSGCTPEEEQGLRDAVNTAVQNFGTTIMDFATGFARQSIAAFLF